MGERTDHLFGSLPRAVPGGGDHGYGGGGGRKETHRVVLQISSGAAFEYGEDVARWAPTQDTRQALVKHEHLYLIYILTICT